MKLYENKFWNCLSCGNVIAILLELSKTTKKQQKNTYRRCVVSWSEQGLKKNPGFISCIFSFNETRVRSVQYRKYSIRYIRCFKFMMLPPIKLRCIFFVSPLALHLGCILMAYMVEPVQLSNYI